MTEPAPSGTDISVIVPTRNRAVLVARLLGQLVRIDDDLTYEVIVIDEGSSDDTPAVLAGFAADHGVRVVRHDDPVGLPAARNVGLRLARGRYVAWIDDDDLTSTDRLRRQHQALEAGPARWSCAGRVDIDDDLAVIGHMRCPDPEGFDRSILRINSLPTAAQGLLVEKALLDEVGGYDETLRAAEDWELCIRLADRSAPHFLDEPLVGYRTGVASMSTDTARMDEAIERVVARHADRYARHRVAPDWAAIHQSLLPADLLGGRRPALRRAVRAVRAQPSPKATLRTAAVLAAPRWFEARSARARRRQVPDAWVAQARGWLDELPRPAPAGDLATQRVHGLDMVSEATVDEVTDWLLRQAADDGARGWRGVITPNVDHIVRYHRNPREAAVAARAALVLPDGMPIVWTSRLVGRPLRRRLPGSDLFTVFWPRLGREAVATVVVAPSDQVVAGLRADHATVRGVVPPFFDADDDREVAAVVDEVAAAADEVAARFVLVLLSMAKCHVLADRLAERWADRPGPQPIVMLLGASADFHVGLVRRAPVWMRRAGLEWLHRLAGDPRRMARRYLLDDPLYAVLAWREWRHRSRQGAP